MSSSSPPDLVYYCDEQRHLVCVPYSRKNLHAMAAALNIARCWFHLSPSGAHYDIPMRRVDEIRAKCRVVTPRTILLITRGIYPDG